MPRWTRPARAFYEFHAALMEPWDGPACITFTDGTLIGAVLDRNGLRPSRYWVTEDGLVVLASEVGVLDLDPATVVRKGRLQPGRMFLVDTDRGRIVDDAEIKAELAAELRRTTSGCTRADPPRRPPEREHVVHTHASGAPAPADLRLHGGGAADPPHADGPRRRGADRVDGHRHAHRRAVRRPRLLFDYFSQLFAQVTNPPLDAIREELVTSLGRHDRARPEPADADAGPLPAGRPAVPGDRQRRALEGHAGQR